MGVVVFVDNVNFWFPPLFSCCFVVRPWKYTQNLFDDTKSQPISFVMASYQIFRTSRVRSNHDFLD